MKPAADREPEDERHPEQCVLHGEHVTAQCVVDVDLHGGIGAQLDHLTSRAEQKAAQHHHRQLQSGGTELDDRRQQQRAVGGAKAAPPSDGTRRDDIRNEGSQAARGEEQRSGAKPHDILGVAVPHHHQHQHRVDAERDPMRGQSGEGARHGGQRQHRACAVQPSGRDRVRHRPVDRALAGVRAEYMRRESQRQQQRGPHRNRDDENDCGGTAVIGAEQ